MGFVGSCSAITAPFRVSCYSDILLLDFVPVEVGGKTADPGGCEIEFLPEFVVFSGVYNYPAPEPATGERHLIAVGEEKRVGQSIQQKRVFWLDVACAQPADREYYGRQLSA